jgi:Septum formation
MSPLEAPTNVPPSSPQRDWVAPVVVLVIALAIVAALVIVGINLLGGDSSEPTPSAVASESGSASPSASAAVETEVAASPSAAPPGEETSVFDLEVGDCFSVDSDQFDTVLVVDCGQPHEYEAFHVFDHAAGPDEPYPGDDPLFEFADTECQPPFEEFVGHEYQTSIWYITSITPSEDTWADGDREIVCTLNQQDENEEPITVTGSAEGSAQ